MNENGEVVKTKEELYSDCDEANSSLETSTASESQILLLKGCNFLITAFRIERGEGFVSKVAKVFVPFIYYMFNGKCGDVVVGNIKSGEDSMSIPTSELSHRNS